MSIGLYGPRVVGDEEFRRQQEVVARAAQIYGPRVTGGRAEAKTTAEPPKATASAPQPAAPEAGGGDGEPSEPTNIEAAGGDEAVLARGGVRGLLGCAEVTAEVMVKAAAVVSYLDQ